MFPCEWRRAEWFTALYGEFVAVVTLLSTEMKRACRRQDQSSAAICARIFAGGAGDVGGLA